MFASKMQLLRRVFRLAVKLYAPQGIARKNHAFCKRRLENAEAFYGGELTRGNA